MTFNYQSKIRKGTSKNKTIIKKLRDYDGSHSFFVNVSSEKVLLSLFCVYHTSQFIMSDYSPSDKKRCDALCRKMNALGSDAILNLMLERAAESTTYLAYIEELISAKRKPLVEQKEPKKKKETPSVFALDLSSGSGLGFTKKPKSRETLPASFIKDLSNKKPTGEGKSLSVKKKSSRDALTKSAPIPNPANDKYTHVSCVLEDEEVQKMFMQFLKKQRCEENLLFLIKVNNLANVSSDKILT